MIRPHLLYIVAIIQNDVLYFYIKIINIKIYLYVHIFEKIFIILKPNKKNPSTGKIFVPKSLN